MSRLGIVLYHGIEGGPDLAGYGRLAEDSGFESLWVTERYFHEETFSLLGYLAAATRSIKLGVGVVNPFTRNPALLAMASATLDRISDGRFALGLGRSDQPVIEGRMAIPYADSLSSLEEAVGLVRRLLSGERVTDLGGRFPLDGVRLAISPVQDRVPIYLAGIGPKALRLAGAVADGVLLNAYTSAEYVRYAVRQVRRRAREAGRDPEAVDIACMLVVRMTDDPASLLPELRRRVVRLLAEPHVGEVLLEKGGFDPSILGPLRASTSEDAASLISDELVEAFYVLGPAERCRERVAEYREAGVDLPLLLPRLDAYAGVVRELAP